MRKLKLCLEAQTEDNLGVPEPPKPDAKEKQFIVMQGPLSTTFALTLMKRFSTPEPSDQFVRHEEEQNPQKLPEATTTTIEQATGGATVDATEHTDVNRNKDEPQSLAMEMQMAFLTNSIETIGQRNDQATAEIAADLERYKSYIVMTTRSQFVHLDSSVQG